MCYRKGDSLISGVDKTIVKLRALGKKIFFVTNNSTKSRKVGVHALKHY
ncbi:hypothetical protein EON64_03300 [archaeon]|nr:MAG: hypothetical protein EON64_03300 [archaeon]